jgi:hypothetical protein
MSSSFNNSKAFNGGFIYFNSKAEFISIIDSIFDRIEAIQDGGLLYFHSNVINLSIKSCNFTDITAQYNGGVFYMEGDI